MNGILKNRAVLSMSMALFVFAVAGCEKLDPAELELLKRDDPRFQQMIAKKNEIGTQIRGLESDLAEKKAVIEKKIDSLKSAYEKERAVKQDKIDMLKDKVRNMRSAYGNELEKKTNLLELKKANANELSATLQDAEDILSRKSTLQLAPSEVSEWETRAENLRKQMEPLLMQIQELESEVALRKKKLKYL